MNLFSQILIYLMIVGSFIVFLANIIDIFKHTKKKRRFSDAGWAKWSYAFLGLYWFIAYSILCFGNAVDKYAYTSAIIRPSMVYMIFLLLLSNQKPIYLPDLIKDIFKKLKKKGEEPYGKH